MRGPEKAKQILPESSRLEVILAPEPRWRPTGEEAKGMREDG